MFQSGEAGLLRCSNQQLWNLNDLPQAPGASRAKWGLCSLILTVFLTLGPRPMEQPTSVLLLGTLAQGTKEIPDGSHHGNAWK